MHILTVCLANVCRSPLAEGLLQHELGPEFQVTSAGIAARSGMTPDPRTTGYLADKGIALSGKTSSKLSADLVSQAELILVMEDKHIKQVCSAYPFARGKTMLLGHWRSGENVADPIRLSASDYLVVAEHIEEFCQDWVKEL